MADRRGILVPLIILGFIFFSPDPGRAPANRFEERPRVEDVIAEERRSLSVLQNSSYGELETVDGHVLNLTGLEPDKGYAWDALPKIKTRAQQQLEYALGDAGKEAIEQDHGPPVALPLYHNVTGYVHGKWVRSKLQESVSIPQLNLSSYAPEGPFGSLQPTPFGRNITGDEGGDLRLRFHEKESPQAGDVDSGAGYITEITAEVTIQDFQSGDEAELQVRGVYFADFGQAIMTTTSDKFAGVFMLPQFALSEHMFTAAKALMNESISRTIKHQVDSGFNVQDPWSANVDGTVTSPFDPPNCELIIYLQQLPPTGITAAYSSTLLSFLERELRFPTGAFVPPAPELRFSMLAFSPDCGYVLESKGEPDFVPQDGTHLTGPKIEVLYNSGRKHLFVFTLALGTQMVLLMRQMREASTPSTRSRISFYTIAMLALGDGFATMTFLLISLFFAGLWVNLIGTAFLAFVSVSFFGMRFLLDIWTVQAPERERRAREEAEQERQRQERLTVAFERFRAERLARTAAASSTTGDQPVAEPPTTDATATATPPPPPPPPPTVAAATQTMPGTLPLPVAALPPTDTGATPVFVPSDQDGLEAVVQPATTTQTAAAQGEPRMASFGSLYTRFYLLLLATLFLSLNAASWPAGPRRFYFTTLGLLYMSFWVPQILRNVKRNCRHALNWEFVIGQSVLRMVPFVYFYGYKHNVLFSEQSYISLALLALWLWIQVVVLGSQELIGPRWFIRKDWAPPAYDYHPVLREDEEGATMPIGFAEAASTDSTPASPLTERRTSLGSPIARRSSIAKETKEKGKRIFDCAICMQELEVPVIESGGSRDASIAGGLLARRTYMVTPCRHIFHSACLEGWMKYRLQCPNCRETLPPFIRAIMLSLDDWTNEQLTTFYDPVPDNHTFFIDDIRTPIKRYALDFAMDKVALAVAALHRAGPSPARLSEAFWVFAAGSWSRDRYDTQVHAADGQLPKRRSVNHDVAFAEDKVVEAIALLRKEGDVRDARDLGDALEGYRKESAAW
ncbi:hypothetical protein LTR85_004320 [Meristemomyces frigidus]|nr:hypothetical protein LTR85_004320 [Meristemomyces frigidus]